ncbi:hypothetical protein Tco_0758006, partial [Tanacetum coccineum]
VYNKVDEMLEIAAISYPDNEEFKTLVKYRNERIMNAFKPGKVAKMLDFENVIASYEPLNQEEPNEENIHSADEFFGTQPERISQTELDTVHETPENELEANVDGNVGLTGSLLGLDCMLQEANLNGYEILRFWNVFRSPEVAAKAASKGDLVPLHKGTVLEVFKDASNVSVTLDDENALIVDLGKQGIRFV